VQAIQGTRTLGGGDTDEEQKRMYAFVSDEAVQQLKEQFQKLRENSVKDLNELGADMEDQKRVAQMFDETADVFSLPNVAREDAADYPFYLRIRIRDGNVP
jgi:hypothetical protein